MYIYIYIYIYITCRERCRATFSTAVFGLFTAKFKLFINLADCLPSSLQIPAQSTFNFLRYLREIYTYDNERRLYTPG